MANIINFPKGANRVPAVEPTAEFKPANEPTRLVVSGGLVKVVWVVAVLVWPVLKWVVTLDVLFQFVRMLYHWNTPGVFAGWTFMLHFTVLTALTYFVSMYKPKGL